MEGMCLLFGNPIPLPWYHIPNSVIIKRVAPYIQYIISIHNRMNTNKLCSYLLIQQRTNGFSCI